MNGILFVHKPKGPTSHDVVARLRRLLRTRRIGHAGTLDPMAEGVLVCAVGQAARILPWLTGLPKEYVAEMLLGAHSDTYDAEGRVVLGQPTEKDEGGRMKDEEEGNKGENADLSAASSDLHPSSFILHPSDAECLAVASGVTAEAIGEALHHFLGHIQQAAPPYSAIKVAGRHLYDYARRGEEVPVKVRDVWVERLELLRYLPPRATFLARIGSGTYIRSLAHDTGRMLGCGAVLTKLVRTRVGPFHLDDAARLEALEAAPDEALAAAMLTIAQALPHMPKVTLTPVAAARLRHGAAFGLDGILECDGPQPVGCPVLALDPQGEPLAVVQADAAEGPYRPLRVLVNGEE
jgi:tRNA pseudouridine55 synthase